MMYFVTITTVYIIQLLGVLNAIMQVKLSTQSYLLSTYC